MLFLLALAISILFVCFLDKALKAHPYPFYIGAALVTIIIFSCDFSGAPLWVNKWVIGLFSKGAMGTALFVIVMYAGALKNGTKLIGKLMRIRGELSIFAAILVLAHNLTYGKVYFKYLFQRPEVLSSTQLRAAVISIILIIIMVILTITSFPQVRRKMNPKSWKKLQRSAYAFYGLIYVHILLINMPYARRGMNEYKFNVAVYTIVFVTYGVMRIRKFLLKKKREKIKENAGIEKKINISAVIINVFVVICVLALAFIPKNEDKTVYSDISSDKNGNSENKEDELSDDTKKSEEPSSDNNDKESTYNDTSGNIDDKNTESDTTGNEENTTQESITENPDESTGQNTQQPENNQSQNNQSQNNEAQANNEKPQSNPPVQPDTIQQQPAQSEETQQTTEYKEPETTVKRTYREDGEYTGRATVDEFDYDVSVTVTIKDDKISNVAIKTYEEFFEDEEYAYKASSSLKSKLLSNQGTDGVDAVSGATYTSNAIFKAFNSALESAKN